MKRLTKRDTDWPAWPLLDRPRGALCTAKFCALSDRCDHIGDRTCPYLQIVDHLVTIEDILGDDYDLDELKEMVQAKREGRCVVLPCKKGDTVWRIVHDATPHITKDRCTNIKVENKEVWVNLIGDRVMGGWHFGKVLFLNEKEAEDALKAREQDE